MKKVFVSGANNGIGLSITKLFLDKGYYVYALSRSVANLEKISSKNIKILKVDLSKDIESLDFDDILSGVDILINNVGIMTGRSFEEYTYSDLVMLFNTNLFTAYLLAKSFLREMDLNRKRKIINVSSIAGIQGSPDIPYAMSKAGINMLGLSLAEIYRDDKNISIHTVIPGPIDTNMIETVAEQDRKKLAKHTMLLSEPITQKVVIENIISLIENDISSKQIILSNGVVWKN